MKHAIALAALLLAVPAIAQEPARDPGYDALDGLVGRWTIAGREGKFLEVCDWYHGRRHMVCNTESTRDDGSTSHGMSILGFVPGEGYVYTGIGSRGRYETYRGGTFRDGILEYLDTAAAVRTRIRVGPFTDPDRVPFNVHTSKDGVAWEAADGFHYVRVK
jgi:hypothetical protein